MRESTTYIPETATKGMDARLIRTFNDGMETGLMRARYDGVDQDWSKKRCR